MHEDDPLALLLARQPREWGQSGPQAHYAGAEDPKRLGVTQTGWTCPPGHMWRVEPVEGWAGLPVVVEVDGTGGRMLITDTGWRRGQGSLEMPQVVRIIWPLAGDGILPLEDPPGLVAAGALATGATKTAGFQFWWAPVDLLPPIVNAQAPRLLYDGPVAPFSIVDPATLPFLIPAGQPGLWVECDTNTVTCELLQTDSFGGVARRISCGFLPADATTTSGVSGTIPCGGLNRPSLGWIVSDGAANVRIWAP